jgi:hypothetical protein
MPLLTVYNPELCQISQLLHVGANHAAKHLLPLVTFDF